MLSTQPLLTLFLLLLLLPTTLCALAPAAGVGTAISIPTITEAAPAADIGSGGSVCYP
jgi:hypothetical protein